MVMNMDNRCVDYYHYGKERGEFEFTNSIKETLIMYYVYSLYKEEIESLKITVTCDRNDYIN